MKYLLIFAVIGAIIAIAFVYIQRNPPEEPILPAEQYEVHFFDVGQGDCTLLDCGEYEVLIDGGPVDSDVTLKINDYVDGHLEAIIITHPHADHIGDIRNVLRNFTVDALWKNTDTADTNVYRDVMENIKPEKVYLAVVGENITVGPFSFAVLSSASGTDINENSIVLELDTAGAKFLFMGDAGTVTERTLLLVNKITDIDILKIGHHGSTSASSPWFIQTAAPEIAIYTAGIGNSYGHPNPSILALYKRLGVDVYGTDTYGDISVNVGTDNYTLNY